MTEFPLAPDRNQEIFGTQPDSSALSGSNCGKAQEKSGAMITVGFALEQGKDVFAVPGPSPARTAGPHILLQEGARLVSGVEDILEEWGWT